MKDWDCHAHKIQKRSLAKTEGEKRELFASLLAKTEGKRKLATSEGRRRGLPRSQNTKAFARKDGREKRELFASPRNDRKEKRGLFATLRATKGYVFIA